MPNDTTQTLAQEQRLWITFQLNGEDYCIGNEHMLAMMIPTEIQEMPNDAPHMLGVMQIPNGSVPVVNLRILLGMESVEDSISTFGLMRQMHLDWINALRDSVENHTPFEKAVDPHMCMFGKWYDNFETDNISLRFILNKIGPPHEYIHLHGADVKRLMEQGDYDGARQKYEEALVVCEEQVLPLLDELIQTFREINRGIVMLISYGGRTFGLMVDEIDALIPADRAEELPVPKAVSQSPYVDAMVLYEDRTYAALNIAGIAGVVDDKDAAARELDEMRR